MRWRAASAMSPCQRPALNPTKEAYRCSLVQIVQQRFKRAYVEHDRPCQPSDAIRRAAEATPPPFCPLLWCHQKRVLARQYRPDSISLCRTKIGPAECVDNVIT